MDQSTKQVTAKRVKDTKNFARYDLDDPYTGSVYVPIDEAKGLGSEITVTITAKQPATV